MRQASVRSCFYGNKGLTDKTFQRDQKKKTPMECVLPHRAKAFVPQRKCLGPPRAVAAGIEKSKIRCTARKFKCVSEIEMRLFFSLSSFEGGAVETTSSTTVAQLWYKG